MKKAQEWYNWFRKNRDGQITVEDIVAIRREAMLRMCELLEEYDDPKSLTFERAVKIIASAEANATHVPKPKPEEEITNAKQ